jgi:hypothetical protein
MGGNGRRFIHPEDLEAIVNKWRSSLASGEPFLHEARVFIESKRSYISRGTFQRAMLTTRPLPLPPGFRVLIWPNNALGTSVI